MITSTADVATYRPSVLRAGDRVRVASGVLGRLGRIRSTSVGHVLVQYDLGEREVIDLTRRPLWVIRTQPPQNIRQ
ncbi:MAG TPA: hypothetical protein VL634_06350 [Mycobacterium sp.]|nr:hypothetical protein [Mycobacterium sp.]